MGWKASIVSHIDFPENDLLPLLFGQHDLHLRELENMARVSIASRSGHVTISGDVRGTEIAKKTLAHLYQQLLKSRKIDAADLVAAFCFSSNEKGDLDLLGLEAIEIVGGGRRHLIKARTPAQSLYMRALKKYDLAFSLGPAGTGKTYLAVAAAVASLLKGDVDRVILSRPAVEAGERLGFLPGDLREKIEPYLRPLYDALHAILPLDIVTKKMNQGEIEIAPLAYMRGRTLSNAFIILDEGQNTTAVQMKMFLTRLGENSRMVVTGDLTQVDLPFGVRSGLRDALEAVEQLPDVSISHFTDSDIVRHPLVVKIVQAYEKRDQKIPSTHEKSTREKSGV